MACGMFVWCTEQIVCFTAGMLVPPPVVSAETREEETQSEYLIVLIASRFLVASSEYTSLRYSTSVLCPVPSLCCVPYLLKWMPQLLLFVGLEDAVSI